MKKLYLILVLILISCSQVIEQKIQISPLNELEQVDKLISQLSRKPEIITISSKKKTTITGSKGTIIHIDPNNLETLDSSNLSAKIELELLEIVESYDFLTMNLPTSSNGNLLISGGAYYINMTSNGKQLKIKNGKKIDVEFPKLVDNEMALFLGERDSVGQINWIQTKDNFKKKNIKNLLKPTKPRKKIPESRLAKIEVIDFSQIEAILEHVEGHGHSSKPKPVKKNVVSEEEYSEYLLKLAEYEKKQAAIEYRRKTYKAVELLNFGWINCDRFLKDSNPKIDIQLVVKNDSIKSSRFFALFKDINSIMSSYYVKELEETPTFRKIPKGQNIKIVGLSVKNNKSYIYEKELKTDLDEVIEVTFQEISQGEIKKRLMFEK